MELVSNGKFSYLRQYNEFTEKHQMKCEHWESKRALSCKEHPTVSEWRKDRLEMLGTQHSSDSKVMSTFPY